jgi:hypothetical protein
MATKIKVEDAGYAPLYARKETILKHWGLLRGELGTILPRDGGNYYFEQSELAGVTGLLSSGSLPHRIIRDRGGVTPIVPLLEEEDHTNASYWLSFYQSWSQNPNPKREQLIYNTTSITVYFGDPTSPEKLQVFLQLFRAEWPGVRVHFAGRDENFVFEAPGAGHPHWQFDAYQTRATEVEVERQRLLDVSRALEQNLPEVEDFGELAVSELSSEEEERRLLCMGQVTRVHFASNAEWATTRWYGNELETKAHARGPANANEIIRWAISSLVYIQSELRR